MQEGLVGDKFGKKEKKKKASKWFHLGWHHLECVTALPQAMGVPEASREVSCTSQSSLSKDLGQTRQNAQL